MAGKAIDVQIAGIKALRNRLSLLTDDTLLLETLRKRLADVWARGAQQFVQTAIREMASLGKPGSNFVDTGFTAATFWALSKALNADPYNLKRALQIVDARISVPSKFQKGVPQFPKGSRKGTKGRFQDVGEGKTVGERAYVFSVPEKITGTGGLAKGKHFVFKFSFQTVSWQLAFHDQGRGEDAGRVMNASIEAFEARVARQFEQQARLVLDGFFGGRKVPSQGIKF